MQLNVFSTDNQKSGFRLQYMQVLNWGTVDKEIYWKHRFRITGEEAQIDVGKCGVGSDRVLYSLPPVFSSNCEVIFAVSEAITEVRELLRVD